MNRHALLFLIGSIGSITGCNNAPSEQTPAEYYRNHPDAPNPRGGSFAKSKPGKYEYTSPAEAGSPSGNATAQYNQ
jgi:hypothetical protein